MTEELDNLMAVIGKHRANKITCKECYKVFDWDEILHLCSEHHVVLSHRQPKRHYQDACPYCLHVFHDKVEEAQHGGRPWILQEAYYW